MRLSSQTSYAFLDMVGGRLLPIVGAAIVARGAGPSEMGAFNFATTTATFLAGMAALGIPDAAARAAAIASRTNFSAPIQAATFAFLALMGGVSVALVVVVLSPFGDVLFPSRSLQVLPLALALTVLQAVINVLTAVLRGSFRSERTAAASLARLVVFLGVWAVLSERTPGPSLTEVVLAAALWSGLAQLAILLAGSGILESRLEAPLRTLRDAWRFGKWNYFWIVIAFATDYGASFLLSKRMGLEGFSVYTLSLSIFLGVSLVSSAYQSVAGPAMAVLAVQGGGEAMRKVARNATSVLAHASLGAGAAAALAAYWILPILFGPTYVESANLLGPLTVSAAAFASYRPISAYCFGIGTLVPNFITGVLLSLLSLLLSLLFFRHAGLAGLAIASATAYLAGLAFWLAIDRYWLKAGILRPRLVIALSAIAAYQAFAALGRVPHAAHLAALAILSLSGLLVGARGLVRRPVI